MGQAIESAENPQVTIVVPLYNAAPYVTQCLQSLQAQTVDGFEAICVDDCSSDGSLQVAKDAVAGDQRFSFAQTPRNMGPGAARNIAIDRARGQFLLFLDSDDYLQPQTLEVLLGCAMGRVNAAEVAGEPAGQPLDDVYFSARTFYQTQELEQTHVEDFSQRMPSTSVMTGPELMVEFVANSAWKPSACMHMVSRQFVERAGLRFAEDHIHEDLLWTMQAIGQADTACYIDQPLYARRMREGSIMTGKRGLANLKALAHIAWWADRWLQRQIEQGLSTPQFADAWAWLVADTLRDAAYDTYGLMSQDDGEDQIAKWLAALPDDERAYFLAHVWRYAQEIDVVHQEYETSHSYRAGRAVLAPMRWVRNRLG